MTCLGNSSKSEVFYSLKGLDPTQCFLDDDRVILVSVEILVVYSVHCMLFMALSNAAGNTW